MESIHTPSSSNSDWQDGGSAPYAYDSNSDCKVVCSAPTPSDSNSDWQDGGSAPTPSDSNPIGKVVAWPLRQVTPTPIGKVHRQVVLVLTPTTMRWERNVQQCTDHDDCASTQYCDFYACRKRNPVYDSCMVAAECKDGERRRCVFVGKRRQLLAANTYDGHDSDFLST